MFILFSNLSDLIRTNLLWLYHSLEEANISSHTGKGVIGVDTEHPKWKKNIYLFFLIRILIGTAAIDWTVI